MEKRNLSSKLTKVVSHVLQRSSATESCQGKSKSEVVDDVYEDAGLLVQRGCSARGDRSSGICCMIFKFLNPMRLWFIFFFIIIINYNKF